MKQKLMTETELLTYLNSDEIGMDCKLSWIRRKRLEGGGIPFQKIDSKVRYRKSTVDRWLESRPEYNSTSEAQVRRAA